MKINVDAPLKQEDIKQLLEGQAEPKYTYLGHPNNMPTQIQFEVENIPEGMDVIAYTKRLIQSQEYGKSIALRVLEEGKLW